VAGLRRGIIPRWSTEGVCRGGRSVYRNRQPYPEDEDLVKDAALFAARTASAEAGRVIYTKASAESPKTCGDIALARLETQFEDYPAAVRLMIAPLAVRPDRLDLRIAQAQFGKRKLTRFDQRIEAYKNLYALSYRDPQWC